MIGVVCVSSLLGCCCAGYAVMLFAVLMIGLAVVTIFFGGGVVRVIGVTIIIR